MKKFIVLILFLLLSSFTLHSQASPRQSHLGTKTQIHIKTSLSKQLPKSSFHLKWKLQNLSTGEAYTRKGRSIFIRLKPGTYLVSVNFSGKTYKKRVIVKKKLRNMPFKTVIIPITAGNLKINTGSKYQKPYFKKIKGNNKYKCNKNDVFFKIKRYNSLFVTTMKCSSLNLALPPGRYLVQIRYGKNYRTHFVTMVMPRKITKHNINLEPQYIRVNLPD